MQIYILLKHHRYIMLGGYIANCSIVSYVRSQLESMRISIAIK